jgi:hypothetical protein
VQKSIIVGKIAVIWALIGLSALFLSAIFRLAPHAIEAIQLGLSPAQWLFTILWSAFMLISEAYQGFYQRFSPRFASRALELYQKPTIKRLLLAPLFCIGFIESTRRLKLTVWGVSTAVTAAVFIVRHIDQPLRGIIDIGVILGLGFGLVSTYIATTQVFLKKE